MNSLPRHGRRAALASALVAIPLACLPTGAVAASDTVASGSGWEVEQAPGGYLVTVDLDKKLPMVSDAPTIEVDGEPIGVATESADGKSLSVFTADASVANADNIEAGWFSKPSNAPTATADPASVAPQNDAPELDENPASIGDYEWTEAVYNFGAQSIELAAIGGVRGELQGKVYLPKSGGARPTVLLLHGRHTSCSTGTTPPERWPCAPGQINVPSFAGYDGTARALASHGYAVVSIAANAINSNDNQLALDRGAQARGQLLLDTLGMLDKASKGHEVVYYDAQQDRDVTLADALADQSALPGLDESHATEGLAPSDFVGRFDLTNVGMMGHSRGGEGVTSAAVLNQALDKPWGINSILPLAPVDFNRMTVPNVPMNVILPYCDGDVSNQQGQHMLDDSRYAFDDDVLRSGVWAMGANHNFYNTVWTPGVYNYSVSDDWSGTNPNSTNALDSVCGTNPSVSQSSIRMTAQEQYDQGTAYMAGWFRLTLGDEQQFLPMFDGSGAVPEVLNGADVRSVATAPASQRATMTTFESTSSLVRTQGSATATVCASTSGRTTSQLLPFCATTLGTSAVPHWTPATNGGNVPATPMTKFAWANETGEVRVTVPKAARNASGFDRLSVKMAADETVTTGTDVTVTVLDHAENAYSAKVSDLNALAVNRLPASGSATLKKIVLQQVNIETDDLVEAGLDLSDIREVRFTGAAGADEVETGAVLLSDLAFENSSVGNVDVKTERTVDLWSPTVAEGNAAGTADIAVYLDKASTKKVTGYVSVLGATTGRGGITMEKVTFQPGETCKVVTAQINGDKLPSTTASTAVTASIINVSGALQGKNALTRLTVVEDDGVTGSGKQLPAPGVQGDACVEAAQVGTTGELEPSADVVAPGDEVTLSASGYRAGESVEFFHGDVSLGTALADGEGAVSLKVTVPGDANLGANAFSTKGAGTAFVTEGEIAVLHSTAAALTMSPEVPAINEPVTLTATLTGQATEGAVEFFNGDVSLGTADVVDGVASLALPGFKAGTHALTASFAQTHSAQAASSNALGLNLVKGKSGIVMLLGAESSIFGSAVKGQVAVSNGDKGQVTITAGGTAFNVTLNSSDRASFTLPASLKPGSYTVSAVFNGTDKVEPSNAATASLKVAKKATTAALSAKSSVKRGKNLTVKTTVKGAKAGLVPTGTAKVYVKTGSKFVLAKTVSLKASAKGVVSTKVKASAKKGAMSIKVVYSGDANYGSSTTSVKAVKIK